MHDDPNYKPQLRPVDAFRLDEEGEANIGVRDGSGLSPAVLTMSEPALLVLSLMDGTRTCAQIQEQFAAGVGQALSSDVLEKLLAHLEQAHLLEGDSFEAYYQGLQDEYCKNPTRPMPYAQQLGIEDDSGSLFRDLLAGVPTNALSGLIRGVIAPHLDYPRGQACYVAAYAALRDREIPQRVVVLGTNHSGRSGSVVATNLPFSTPLGTTPTDTDFIARLEERCGPLRTYELDHAREHSIELQIAWLQHLFGPESFKLVPLLCPDPCVDPDCDPRPKTAVGLTEFARILRELLAEDELDTLLLAGADLSHVGPEFGDEQLITDDLLTQVRRHDLRALEALEAGDPESFVRAVADRGNPTRICSVGCIYALAAALPDCFGKLLHYHQAVNETRQCGVTCAAVVFA